VISSAPIRFPLSSLQAIHSMYQLWFRFGLNFCLFIWISRSSTSLVLVRMVSSYAFFHADLISSTLCHVFPPASASGGGRSHAGSTEAASSRTWRPSSVHAAVLLGVAVLSLIFMLGSDEVAKRGLREAREEAEGDAPLQERGRQLPGTMRHGVPILRWKPFSFAEGDYSLSCRLRVILHMQMRFIARDSMMAGSTCLLYPPRGVRARKQMLIVG
jgi:hypothetical protein